MKSSVDELSKKEEGWMTAYQLLRHAGATIPDALQLQVWEIEECHPWLKEVRGMTAEFKSYIGPTGLTYPKNREKPQAGGPL